MPLRLSPLELDEPAGQADPRQPAEAESEAQIDSDQAGETAESPELWRSLLFEAQIATLHRPVSEIRLSNLAATPGISREGLTDAPDKLITSNPLDSEIPTEKVTSYTRQRLYFEDAPLERRGQSGWHLPPGIWTNTCSATKFLVDSAALPFRAIRDCHRKQVVVVAR